MRVTSKNKSGILRSLKRIAFINLIIKEKPTKQVIASVLPRSNPLFEGIFQQEKIASLPENAGGSYIIL
jgi:hypothetical protein